MLILYERIKCLCEEKNIKIANMAADLCLRQSLFSDLKSGRTKSLSAVNLSKIANYFDVSVDYLLGNTDIKKEPATVTGDTLTQQIIEKLAILTPENRAIALAQLDFLLDRQEKQEN